MPCCLIGLGSNLGNRRKTLDEAVARLNRHPQITLIATSPWQETPPVGGPPGQGAFLNGAAVLQTGLAPEAVLRSLQRIEAELGRGPGDRWGPRTLDLDLLLYDRTVLRTPSLELPHPRMAWRRFVLEPAAAVAGSMVHPTTGWTVARLLEHLNTAAPYVAITGAIGVGKTHLARRVAERTSARPILEPVDWEQLEAFYADPSMHAWQTELQFLTQRGRLLAADSPEWSRQSRPAVSDFWFDQSAAFAAVWLRPRRQEAFRRRFEQLRRGVVRPKLLVLLELPADRLRQRLVRRGRACEQALGEDQLERIGRAIHRQATSPDQGPLLHVAHDDPEEILREVLAAMAAMQ